MILTKGKKAIAKTLQMSQIRKQKTQMTWLKKNLKKILKLPVRIKAAFNFHLNTNKQIWSQGGREALGLKKE